ERRVLPGRNRGTGRQLEARVERGTALGDVGVVEGAAAGGPAARLAEATTSPSAQRVTHRKTLAAVAHHRQAVDHAIADRARGIPATMPCGLPPAGGKRMTSQRALSSAVAATSCTLM